MSQKLRIVFLGTPEFAVPSLDILVRNGYTIPAVVTAPDKPAGRGRKVKMSDVKQYALDKGLSILQPSNLKDPAWIEELASLKADLQVVVAFRMLPEAVWNMPPMGTLNLHASLLPQYRGAAPIAWAIMNGEKETGLSTFFLQHEIDTGNIVFRETVPIGPEQTVGELHDVMMHAGAKLLLKTVDAVAAGNYPQVPQASLDDGRPLHAAPRIYRETCHLRNTLTAPDAYNRIRGLSPYPCAFVEMNDAGIVSTMKVFRAGQPVPGQTKPPGTVESDGKTFFRLHFTGGSLDLTDIQPEGRARMSVRDYLNGRKPGALPSFT